jgi:hypothetical protein
MYGKTKMTSAKMPKKEKKAMPLAIMIAVGKPMPKRGERTAKNMMKKTGRGK